MNKRNAHQPIRHIGSSRFQSSQSSLFLFFKKMTPSEKAAHDYIMRKPYSSTQSQYGEEHENTLMREAFLAGVSYAAGEMEKVLGEDKYYKEYEEETRDESLREIARMSMVAHDLL